MNRIWSVIFFAVACCFITTGLYAQGQGHLVIDDYPKVVEAGKTADVVIAWNNVPVKKGFVLRLQLENWDVQPGICVVEDVESYSSTGSIVLSLKVPENVNGASGCRFIAAFLSKSEGWDNALTVASSEKDVTIESLLMVKNYSRQVIAGENASVTLSWRDIPVDGEYKLVVQLENWDVKPGVCEVKTIDNFKQQEKKVIEVPVSKSIRSVENCRFVAAFISKRKAWDDVYALAATDKDVSINEKKE